jgi:uncharacterized phiE125 gp8 family phage protein
MGVKLITAPASEPVTLAEAKAQCRVDISTDDTYISNLIIAAREWCEQFDWRVYMPQTWEFYLDAWPSRNTIEIPKPPLQSITSVKYTDADDVETTLSSSQYIVDAVSDPGWLILKSLYTWPAVTLRDANGIAIRFVCGYANAASVPMRIKQAILLLVGHWYENRETVLIGSISKSIEHGVISLLGINRGLRF